MDLPAASVDAAGFFAAVPLARRARGPPFVMKNVLLIGALSAALAAAAPSDTFGVYLVTTFDAPGARTWRLLSPGGAVETISLEPAALLDATAIASADAERGPGGDGAIRLVLTATAAQRLAEVTSRNVGRRLGLVVAGRLRAAPAVLTGITNGVLVVGGLEPAEVDELAGKLGPPAASIRPAPAAGSREAVPDSVVLRSLEGTWSLVRTTMNGQVVQDLKSMGATWTFRGGTLSARSGNGETFRFVLATDAAAPNAVRLDPETPPGGRALWFIFKRDGDRVALLFFDGVKGRPSDFAPAPQKVILELSRSR